MLGVQSLGLIEAVLLLAMGFGYVVIFLGNKVEDKNVKGLGHVIGMTMIALSVLFIFLTLTAPLILGQTRVFKNCPGPGMGTGMRMQPPAK